MSVLIAFGTVEGQSGKIARYIKSFMTGDGEGVELFDTSLRLGSVNWDDFYQVILVAPVHERKHPKDFEIFLSSHQEELRDRRVLLLSVSLSAAFPEGLKEAQEYVDELKLRTSLEPDAVLLVPGAIRTRRYDYYETQILRHVVLKGRDFDPDVSEFEFTDWQELTEKVRKFLWADRVAT